MLLFPKSPRQYSKLGFSFLFWFLFLLFLEDFVWSSLFVCSERGFCFFLCRWTRHRLLETPLAMYKTYKSRWRTLKWRSATDIELFSGIFHSHPLNGYVNKIKLLQLMSMSKGLHTTKFSQGSISTSSFYRSTNKMLSQHPPLIVKEQWASIFSNSF